MTTASNISGDGPPEDGSRYDAIVVGAGHNGLIAAGYLAKAGKKVLVLERRSIIGGATVTEEWFPGYHLSTCSYVCNLLLPEVIADLELERYGYEVRPFDPQYFVPFPDGSYFMSFLDGSKTREQIAKFSQRDVAGYDAYWAMWDRILERMRPLLLQPAPTWDQIEARFSGPQGQEDWRTLTRKSIAELLDEYFESDQIKAPLSTGGVIGVNAGPMTPGTAYVKYHHLIGSIGGHQGAWGFVRGGMGSIPKAIAAFGRQHGVEIATDSDVAEIEIQDGSAKGVRTVDGRRYLADIILSNADPTRTFLRMVGESHLPADSADGLTPPGKHTMSLFVQYAPYDLSEGTWDQRRDEIGANIVDTLAMFAPNIPNAIEHLEVLGPPDIERIIGITGGNIFHGEILPDQMFGYRPVPGYSDYRTPVDRLYLCGSGAWPAGAVFGAPGRNCALEALRDLGSNPSSVAPAAD